MSREPSDLEEENRALKARIAELEKSRQKETETLAERIRLFEEMLETVPVGVVVADAKGEILFGNSEIEQMVGHRVLHSSDTASYGEWVSYHPDGRRVESEEYPLARVFAEEVDEDELEARYERPDGSRFWMRIIGKAIRDDDGEQIGAAVAVIDVDAEHQAADAQRVMIKELNHRVKNAFSVTQAITSRTLRTTPIPTEARIQLDERLQAYADAHSRLVGNEWDRAPLMQVASEVLEPIAGDRLTIEGPDVVIMSRTALSLSMAFFELATNAVKHGALAEDDGRVELRWKLADFDGRPSLEIDWRETGGPAPTAPSHQGFGSFILDRAVAGETGGNVLSDYAESGFTWRVTMPCAGNVDV